MKNIFILLASLTLLSASCKKKTESHEAPKTAVVENTYQVSSKGSEVYWTGYKFTDKKGVKGKFKTIDVTNAPVAKTQLEALNGTEFSIPVSSVFSKNAARDGKLATLFFGVMDQTEFLTGSFVTKGESLALNLKMNGVTKQIPVAHKISDRHVKIDGVLKISDFSAQGALDSIHKACELLHTGKDGVSKTWDEVAVEAIVYLK